MDFCWARRPSISSFVGSRTRAVFGWFGTRMVMPSLGMLPYMTTPEVMC